MKMDSAMLISNHVLDRIINATPGLNTTVHGSHGNIQVIPSNIGTGHPVVVNGSSINFTKLGVVDPSVYEGFRIEAMNNDSFEASRVRLETPWGVEVNGTEAIAVRINFPRTNITSIEEKWSYIKFIGNFSRIQYSPSLWDNLSVELLRSDYNPDLVDYYLDWDLEALDNFEIYLALANGLIYSTSGNFAIVKNCSSTHLCAKWNTNDIRFMQTTTLSGLNPAGETWEFYIVPNISISVALQFANIVNTNAPMTISEAILS
jgi:hypothetical protein